MLSKISWEQYWTFLGILTLSYLLVIILAYYRRDLLLLGKKKGPTGPSFRRAANDLVNTPQSDCSIKDERNAQESKLFPMVHDLMEELKGVFITASESGSNKQELLMGIQLKLRLYLPLRASEFHEGIVHHIIMESNEHCGIALHGGDIQAIWE